MDGTGIKIAVIDTGVDFNHPDLFGWGGLSIGTGLRPRERRRLGAGVLSVPLARLVGREHGGPGGGRCRRGGPIGGAAHTNGPRRGGGARRGRARGVVGALAGGRGERDVSRLAGARVDGGLRAPAWAVWTARKRRWVRTWS